MQRFSDRALRLLPLGSRPQAEEQGLMKQGRIPAPAKLSITRAGLAQLVEIGPQLLGLGREVWFGRLRPHPVQGPLPVQFGVLPVSLADAVLALPNQVQELLPPLLARPGPVR